MPDYERVLDDLKIDSKTNLIKKSYYRGYKEGKTQARIEFAVILALFYFTIAAIGSF